MSLQVSATNLFETHKTECMPLNNLGHNCRKMTLKVHF